VIAVVANGVTEQAAADTDTNRVDAQGNTSEDGAFLTIDCSAEVISGYRN
jgi:hypothetical protein